MSSEIEKWIGFVPPIDSKDLIPTKASLVTTASPKPKQNAIPLNTAIEPLVLLHQKSGELAMW